VYFAQLIWQPLTAWALVKFPLGKFIAANVLLWGVSLACMAAATDFAGLMVTRFLLGSFEATIGKLLDPVTEF
jgi:MFS family permease